MDETSRWLALVLTCRAYNGIFHSIYGGPFDFHVYFEHRHTALLTLLAGASAAASASVRSLTAMTTAGALSVCAVGTSYVGTGIFERIPKTSQVLFEQQPFAL